jgi:hypothetical protein
MLTTNRRRRSSPLKDKTGMKYFRLTVIEHIACNISNGSAIWRCLCECGKYHDVDGRLLSGKSGVKSCGCLLAYKNTLRPSRDSVNITHGESGTKSSARSREYIAWSSMIQRCTNPKHASFIRYGGSGITVCERWINSYELFLLDMGRKPSPHHSIDRIDVLLGYSPENCRWATMDMQQNNRTNNRTVLFEGDRITCTELSRKVGVPRNTMFNWVNSAGTNDVTNIIYQRLAKRLSKESPR